MPKLPTDTPLQILILGLARGDAPYASTAWSLAQHWAQRHQVWYVENPFTWKDQLLRGGSPILQKRRVARQQNDDRLPPLPDQHPGLEVLVPPHMLPVNFLPPGALYDSLMRRNQRRFSHWLEAQLHLYGFQPEFVLNLFNPFYPFPELRVPSPRIYYCVDRISAAPYLQRHGPRWEKQRIREADYLLATSQQLFAYCQQQSSSPLLLLPNAADVGLFRQAVDQQWPVPEALSPYTASPHPHLLYVGAVEERIDTALVREILTQRPDWHWWWVGPVQEAVRAALSDLRQCHFVGPLPQRALLPWLQHCQVGTIPFRRSDFTVAIYPLKVHEYQAAGLPVVSTPFSPDIAHMAPSVLLGQTAEDWIQHIEKANREAGPTQRTAISQLATPHSWEVRSETLLQWLASQSG